MGLKKHSADAEMNFGEWVKWVRMDFKMNQLTKGAKVQYGEKQNY